MREIAQRIDAPMSEMAHMASLEQSGRGTPPCGQIETVNIFGQLFDTFSVFCVKIDTVFDFRS